MLRQATADGFSLDPDDIWDQNVTDDGKVRKVRPASASVIGPKFEAALEAMERGEVQVIVAERFDRLFRDFDEQRTVIKRVEKAGGRLVTAEGQISHATAETELHANLNGAIAQYGRRTAMERSHDAVQVAINDGVVPWPHVNPGYTRVDGRFVPDPVLASVVADAFWLRTQPRITVFNVMTFLQHSGFPGMTYRRTQTMLAARVYLGEIHANGFEPNLTATDMAIVDRDVWNAAQRKMEPRGRHAKSELLLARQRVLRCGSCDGLMVVDTRHKSRQRMGYRCSFTTSPNCPRHVFISASTVDEIVELAACAASLDVEGRAHAETRARQAADAAQAGTNQYRAALKLMQDWTDEAARDQLQALKDASETAREHADELRRTTPATKTISATEEWHLLTLAEKRELIRATIKRVDIAPGRGADRVTVVLK